MKRETGSGVYVIRNKVDGKVYVGSTTRHIFKRWQEHLRLLNAGKHISVVLQRSWLKYGRDAFEFAVLERCDKEQCIAREQHWIDELKAAKRTHGYNLSPNAGNNAGRVVSQETRAKLSAIQRGKVIPESVRRKMSDALRGRFVSAETRAKRSATLRQPGMRERLGAPTRGKKRSRELVKKTAAGHRGTKRSDETRRRISESKRGTTHSDEAKAKMSAYRKGRAKSPDHVAAMRLSRLLRFQWIRMGIIDPSEKVAWRLPKKRPPKCTCV